MYIKFFRIQNFKSFEDVKVNFNEKINVFTGVNNAGKSTMLEAISLWQECYKKLIQRTNKANKALYIQEGDFMFDVQAGKNIAYTDIISVRSPRYEDIFYNLDRKKTIFLYAELIGDHGLQLEIGFWISSVERADYYKISLYNYAKFNYKLLNNRQFFKDPATAIHVLYAAPLANIAPQEERQHVYKIDYLKQSHTAYLAFRNRMEALFYRKGESGNPYDKFCNQLSTILLDNTGQIQFEFPNANSLDLHLKIKIGAEIPKDISLVGSGTLHIMEILLNIHEQKREFNIILLDEPDSYIHRQLQARLLSILNASEQTQIFITTHNETLIRDTPTNWIFHLEKQPIKEYYPIQRLPNKSPKGLLSSAKATVIQTLAGNGNGLDFITALESDVLFMVEGVNDALRIQKVLSMKNNDMRKFAYWVMGNVDTIFDQLEHYKNVFSEIKNDKTLWEKVVLVFDKDFLTDAQRERLIQNIKSKLKLKQIYIWQSYCFDSVLFSDMRHLTTLLQRYLSSVSATTDTSEVPKLLNDAMAELVTQKIEALKSEKLAAQIEGKIRGELNKRKAKFEKLGFQNVIESDYYLQKAIYGALNAAYNVHDLHKIMEKDDCEWVLKQVFNSYKVSFEMEGDRNKVTNFNDLLEMVNQSTIYSDWEFILKV
jgi:AAA15 family ATPase/GTPase